MEHSSSPTIFSRLRALGHWLLEPSPAIESDAVRAQARLLSLMSLTMSVVGVLLVIRMFISEPDDLGSTEFLAIGACVVLVVIYGLSRTRHYIVSAASFVLLFFVLFESLTFANPDGEGILYYMVLPVLLGGIFFSLPGILLTSVASVVASVLVIAASPDFDYPQYSPPLVFVIVLTVVIIVFTRHQAEVERQRRGQLQMSEMRLRTLMESVTATIAYTSREGVIEFVNRVSDGEPEDIIGKTVYDSVSPDQRDKIKQAIDQVLESRGPVTVDIVSSSPDGRQMWLTTYITPVITRGVVSSLAFVTTDITERVLASREHERLQQEIIEAQQQSIRDLSTPVLPVSDDVIIMPLVGSIDTLRARDITRALLDGIDVNGAQVAILDITGVAVVDTGVAGHLNKAVQAARLKGAHTVITGVSDAVAETIVDLGIDWSKVDTLRDLRSGLTHALTMTGGRTTAKEE
jgi:PAS domain S-box-containing protein